MMKNIIKKVRFYKDIQTNKISQYVIDYINNLLILYKNRIKKSSIRRINYE